MFDHKEGEGMGEDQEDFGAFVDSSVEELPGRHVKFTVRLAHEVSVSVEGPIPVIAAWALDNPAGKLLASSKRFKD
jgi:hypothetical protein